jgi:DNA-directed RNA polymerase subunit RPC12/RpoP
LNLRNKNPMPNSKQAGDIGEREVVELVACPNCGKQLVELPPNYPLYDVQCSGCSFRAQVKTNSSKPKAVIFGAGWEIMDKVLKAGFITPPTFVNFKWQKEEKKYQEIRFYPFVPKKNLKKYQLSPKARRANYWMFNYIDMDKLPYFVVYQK